MLRILDNSSKNVLFTLFFVDDCLLYRMKSKIACGVQEVSHIIMESSLEGSWLYEQTKVFPVDSASVPAACRL